MEAKIVCTKQSPNLQTSETSIDRSPSVTPSSVIDCTTSWTDAAFRGLDLVLEHHKCPKIIRRALEIQLHAYLDNSESETVWLKRVKHVYTYYLARYLRNDLPEEPDVVFQPHGPLRRWIRQRLFCSNRPNTHLWYSWYQAKRSAKPLSDDYVEKAYKKHFETLSAKDPGSDQVIGEIFEDPAFLRVLKDVRQSVRDNYLAGRIDFLKATPSTSASFEKNRNQMGQYQKLRDIAGMDSFGEPVLRKMSFFPRSFWKGKLVFDSVYESFEICGREDWMSLLVSKKEMGATNIKCTIQAVLEPLKARIISKGEALPYYTMKPLQEVLHACMRKMDCFRLIGRPISSTDLIDLHRSSDPEDEWFSIDYSAATDGLSWKYSKRILEFVLQGLPCSEREIALRVLGPHALHYPDGPHTVFKGLQSNGQLMGSIISFPILCLANLGLYLRVTRDHHSKVPSKFYDDEESTGLTISERLSRVLINGDDMLYCAPRSLWNQHVSLGKQVGLEMSLGKAYRHSSYANINSVAYDFPIGKNRSPYQINFLNTGLFFGQSKVLGKSEKVELSDDNEILRVAKAHSKSFDGAISNFAASMNTMLSGALPGRQITLLKRFLHENVEKVKFECLAVNRLIGKLYDVGDGLKVRCRTRNLFLPVSVGGMGVVAPAGWKFKVSLQDKMVAHAYSRALESNLSFQRPLPGYEPVEFNLNVPVPWGKPAKTEDQCVTDSVACLFKCYRSPKSSHLYLRLRGWQCILGIFFWEPTRVPRVQ